jgi:dihydrofolate synthase/folylpolyglutamate synthase
MNFGEAIQYLLSLGHETVAIKLGLRNTEVLLQDLGNPHEPFTSVQIAGTNGKGSTAMFLDSICRAAGISTGLFTSPHLVSVTERIKINGSEISQADFARHATVVRNAAELLVVDGKLQALPTFFEQITAIAFLAFREAGIELGILETGLGGRLDATTVAGAETVAITPLALDHQEYLGETLAQIAAEKAAIIRPGVTAVIAPQPATALAVILKRCAESNVRPVLVEEGKIESVTADGRFTVTFERSEPAGATYEKLVLGLRGKHQIINAAVAIRLAEQLRLRGFKIPEGSIANGLATARHAGRLELHAGDPSLLLDGAHNPSGAQALRDYLDEFVKGPLTLVFGAMNDKQLAEMAATLFPVAHRLVLTRPDNSRAAEINKLHDLAASIVEPDKIVSTRSVVEALRKAREYSPAEGLICVTGSLYLVGEMKATLDAEVSSVVV